MKPDFNVNDFNTDFSKVLPSESHPKEDQPKDVVPPGATDLSEPTATPLAAKSKKLPKAKPDGITLSFKLDLTYEEYKTLQLVAIEQSQKQGRKVTMTALAINQLKKLATKKGQHNE